jgi:hypothetical protein
MIQPHKWTGIIDGKHQPLCKMAVSPVFAEAGYNGAPDGVKPTLNNVAIDNGAFDFSGNATSPEESRKYIECGAFDFGEYDFTITIVFTPLEADNYGMVWGSGDAVLPDGSKFSIRSYQNYIFVSILFPTASNQITEFSLFPLTLNERVIFSIATNRINNIMAFYANGAHITTVNDSSKIPSFGNLVTGTTLRMGMGSRNDVPDTQAFTGAIESAFTHYQYFNADQIKAIHKRLGA